MQQHTKRLQVHRLHKNKNESGEAENRVGGRLYGKGAAGRGRKVRVGVSEWRGLSELLFKELL